MPTRRSSSSGSNTSTGFFQKLFESATKISSFANIPDLGMLLKIFLCHYSGLRTFEQIYWVLGAMIYVVCPIDLIPDFIPVVGFLDDMAAVGYVMTKLKSEVEDFKAWEGELAEPLSTTELLKLCKGKFAQDTRGIVQVVFEYLIGRRQPHSPHAHSS